MPAGKPAECQKQHCKIGLKCKKRGQHWWYLEEKLQLEKKQLADYIKIMCNVGFSPCHKIKETVPKDVKSNKLKTPFKNNSTCKKWFKESEHDIFSTDIRYFKPICSLWIL